MLTQQKWVIMDLQRQLVACGVPRDRELCTLQGVGGKRILTYTSKKKAEQGFTSSGFFIWDAVALAYIKHAYGVDRNKFMYRRTEFLQAVPVTVTFEERTEDA